MCRSHFTRDEFSGVLRARQFMYDAPPGVVPEPNRYIIPVASVAAEEPPFGRTTRLAQGSCEGRYGGWPRGGALLEPAGMVGVEPQISVRRQPGISRR